MIEIIKRGSKTVTTCCRCGCKFSFESEDVQKEDIDNYKGYREFVWCPQCSEQVIILQSK